MPVIPIPTGVAGPLPKDIVRFVLRHSSLSFQKISVVPGVVDSEYIRKIKILILLPTKTVQINKSQRVTQLLLLPYYQTKKKKNKKPLTSQARGHGTFRSSDLAFWVQKITAPRPLKDLLIQENKMSRLSYKQLFRLFHI